MDQGLLATPNLRTFLRFTSRALWMPSGTIHGFDLGNIVMINSAYNVQVEKVPYAFNGQNVLAAEEAIMVAPVWTLKGNQFSTRIKSLLMMGTKQTDLTIGSNAGSPQTITGAIPGASYDLGVRGLTSFTSLTNVGVSVTYVNGTDYEVDLATGMLRIIDGGAISTATTVVATYLSASLTREEYTAFDNQNQIGTLRCFGLRLGDTVVNEEGIFTGNLYTDNMGDTDPLKHREWTMKISVAGSPRFRTLKT